MGSNIAEMKKSAKNLNPIILLPTIRLIQDSSETS